MAHMDRGQPRLPQGALVLSAAPHEPSWGSLQLHDAMGSYVGVVLNCHNTDAYMLFMAQVVPCRWILNFPHFGSGNLGQPPGDASCRSTVGT